MRSRSATAASWWISSCALISLRVGTFLLGEDDVAAANEEEEKDRDEDVGPCDVEEVAAGIEDIAFGEDCE